MLKVVFIGNKEDFLTAHLLKQILGTKDVLEISDKSFSCPKEQPELIIVKSNTLKEINSAGIIVFQSDLVITEDLKINGNAVCVINSSNKNNKEYICSNSLPTVTCGLSDKDTFTISGISEEQAAVSLQRPIKTLSGKMIEPCEFVINLANPVPRYDIMELTAILVLSDNENLLNNITI
jgi:hypothetical protein